MKKNKITFENTIFTNNFANIFKEVFSKDNFCGPNSSSLKIFILDVSNSEFVYKQLIDYLKQNIGSYVFSRAEINDFERKKLVRSIDLNAMNKFKEEIGERDINNSLGELLSYIFIEEINNAPKLFNNIEIDNDQIKDICNGIYINKNENELILGISNIVNDMRDCIDNIFNMILSIKSKDTTKLLKMIENDIIKQKFPPNQVDKIVEMIIPHKNTSINNYDKSYGIFVGYKLGLDKSKYSNQDYRKICIDKIQLDIKNHIEYIKSKIINNNLNNHSFYLYIVPFNDAENDKINIINELIGCNYD